MGVGRMRNRWLAGARRILALAVVLGLVLAGVAAVFWPGQSQETEAKAALAFTAKKTTMIVGEQMVFAVNRGKASWKSSNTKVLKVTANGRVRAVRTGKARITASAGGERVSVKVAVKFEYVIGIDPGHQSVAHPGVEPIGPGSSTTKAIMSGGTSGVSTRKPEYQLNLEIGLALEQELKNRGYQVIMSHRTADADIGNMARAKKLNKRCDVVIRIHADGATASAHGASALYPSATNPYVGYLSADSERLSKCILDYYCQATGIRNRGLVPRDDLTGTNWSTVPVTLIEMGFMTNVFDDEFMSSADGQKKMVQGMANGVDAYFAK